MPLGVSWLSTTGIDPLVPLCRVGVLAISWQFLNLLPSTLSLLLLPSSSTTPASPHPFLTLNLFLSLPLSRLGLWTHNPVPQNIVQTQVPAGRRVQFSGVEMAFMSAAEIGRWSPTLVFSRPQQFKGVAVAGILVIAWNWFSFVFWALRSRRSGYYCDARSPIG